MSLSAMTLVGQQLQDLNSIKAHTNSLANANVAGFQQFIPKVEAKTVNLAGDKELSYVEDQGLWRVTAHGGAQYTGDNLHAALNTDGYFMLQGKLYSRNGAFHRDNQNRLVNAEGIPVLNVSGSEITLPTNGDVHIGQDGSVLSQGKTIDKLGISTFSKEDEQKMQPQGSGMYTDATPVQALTIEMSPGFIETSNVEAVLSISLMLQASQGYAEKQKMINDLRDAEKQAQQQIYSAAT